MKNDIKRKISYACIAFIVFLTVFVLIKKISNRSFMQGTNDLLGYQPDIQYFKSSEGQFPELIKNIVVDKKVFLGNYMWSSPEHCKDKEKLDLYRLAFKANISKEYAKKLKSEIVPNLKKLVGNYRLPDFPDYKSADSLPPQPDLEYYKDTLLKMILSSTRFMVKNDHETALLLSYSAIRLSELLETEYASGGSAETKLVTNSIIRYACCQMLVDIPDTRLNPDFYRALSKDLIKIADGFETVSQTVEFNKNTLIDLLDHAVTDGNYAAAKLSREKFISELDYFFNDIKKYVDEPYREKGLELAELQNLYHQQCEEVLDKFNKVSHESAVANALVYRYLYDFESLKKDDEETLALLEGTSIILALRGASLDKKSQGIKNLGSLEKWLGVKFPTDRLSGDSFEFLVTRKGISLISPGFDGITGTSDDIDFVPRLQLDDK